MYRSKRLDESGQGKASDHIFSTSLMVPETEKKYGIRVKFLKRVGIRTLAFIL